MASVRGRFRVGGTSISLREPDPGNHAMLGNIPRWMSWGHGSLSKEHNATATGRGA